jgi:hypothetical protein
MREFVYSSALPPARYEELADLMFFNHEQPRFRDTIVEAIERYGEPQIVVTDHSLRFSVGDLGEVQTLYALDGDVMRGRLAGAMLYARISEQKVVLLHIGVAHEYTSGGRRSNRRLALKMVKRLKEIGRSVKGVREIEILYSRRASAIRL